MPGFSTAKISKNGQLVIPKNLRSFLKINPGDEFLVYGRGDVVILNKLKTPSPAHIEKILGEVEKSLKKK